MLKRLFSIVIRIYKKIKRILFTRSHIYDVRELFFQQNTAVSFNRYDMIVRLLAVENFYGKNDCGFELYRKMQAARMGTDWVEPAVNRFKDLIVSYEQKGYDKNSAIIIDKNFNLVDGSHRMALAMYYKQYDILCKVIPEKEDISYGIEEFIEYDFSDEEIAIIQNRYELLKNEINVPFVCTLWAPVRDFYDEITEKLSKVGNVIEYKDYTFDEYNYAAIARKIYAVDDIAKWKIEMKIDKMKPYKNKTIRMVLLNIDNPRFRYKSTNQNTLSVTCERIKKMIRNNYKKKIPDYFYDIIMHIGDNYYQNTFIRNLFDYSAIPVKDVLDALNQYKYVLTKIDVPYMPESFPKEYPIGKDIDVFCLPTDCNLIVQTILDILSRSKSPYEIRCVKKTDFHKQIRIELQGFLMFLFDVISDEIDLNFIEGAINNRVYRKSYYVTNSKYELLIRINELKKEPRKVHHGLYIKDNLNSVDATLCDKYLNYNWKKIVENL